MSQLVVQSSANTGRAALEAEISQRFGVLPNFFCSAPDAPEVVRELWAFAKSAYLDNPLPPLFKERLFVYLSRFCEIRYCLVRHLGFLVGRGRPAGNSAAPAQSIEQALALLRQPVVLGPDLEAALQRLEGTPSPLPPPEPETPFERDVFAAAAVMFLDPARCERAVRALSIALGSRHRELLTGFLAFVRTAHYWTLTHPGLEFEEDVEALLQEHETLTQLILKDPESGRCDMGQRLFDELVLLRKEHDEREELRRAKSALEDKDRHKDEFIAMLGHELRNPLATVRTIAQTLPLLPVQDATLQSLSERLNRQTEAMARMVDDLLDASRLGLGKVSIHPERLDLVEIVRAILREREPQMLPNGLQLDLLEEPTNGLSLPVRGDRQRLAQIVENVLDNAIKFTPPPGRVTVRLYRSPSNQAVVEIEDTGIGFDYSMCESLFEPFRQAYQGLDRRQGGLGLGLAISQMLAKLHQGTLSARSPGVGAGATFTLSLPIDQDQASDHPVEDNTPEVIPARPRVLLVEDNEDLADSLAELIQLLGWDVILAYDGPSALQQAQEQTPDVVLCDLGLPGMDGFALAQALRKNRALAHMRLVAMSGYGRSADRVSAEQAGFERLIVKPVDLNEIRKVLSENRPPLPSPL